MTPCFTSEPIIGLLKVSGKSGEASPGRLCIAPPNVVFTFWSRHETHAAVLGSAPGEAHRFADAAAVDQPATGQLASRSVSLPQDGIPVSAGPD